MLYIRFPTKWQQHDIQLSTPTPKDGILQSGIQSCEGHLGWHLLTLQQQLQTPLSCHSSTVTFHSKLRNGTTRGTATVWNHQETPGSSPRSTTWAHYRTNYRLCFHGNLWVVAPRGLLFRVDLYWSWRAAASMSRSPWTDTSRHWMFPLKANTKRAV